MTERAIIAIGGENLIDRVQMGDANGSPVFANNPGGSPFNVAVALARQGGEAHYLTPISDDDMGDLLAERLMDVGVHIASPRRSEPTTMATVTLLDGIPSYDFQREGTAERCVTEYSLRGVLPPDTAALHVGSLALIGGDDAGVWEAVFHRAGQDGIFLTIDPNVRASLVNDAAGYRARLLRMFKSADLIKLSDEDLEWLYPDLDLSAALLSLRSATDAALVVLTKGAEGAEGLTKSDHVAIDPVHVSDLRDTIGAGDTFMGTLLASLADQGALVAPILADFDVSRLTALLNRAAHAAALNCARQGCNPPTLSDIETALA